MDLPDPPKPPQGTEDALRKYPTLSWKQRDADAKNPRNYNIAIKIAKTYTDILHDALRLDKGVALIETQMMIEAMQFYLMGPLLDVWHASTGYREELGNAWAYLKRGVRKALMKLGYGYDDAEELLQKQLRGGFDNPVEISAHSPLQLLATICWKANTAKFVADDAAVNMS